MEMHQLQYVIAVAKHKHFTRAAEEINVGQSGLSQQIAKLEKELGVKLFDRTSRTVLPTPAGAEFIEFAREILVQAETAKLHMDAHAGILKGTLSIGTITYLTNIDFGSMIASFHNKYPGLSLNVRQAGSIKLIELLHSGDVDVALITLPPSEHDDLDFHHLAQDEYVLVTSDKHSFAKRKTIDLTEARNETFIFHKNTQSMHAICIQACNNAGFDPKIFCYSSGSSINFSLIRAGLGIGFFPSEETRSFRIPGLVAIKLREPIKKNIVLATLKKLTYTPPVKAAQQHIMEWVREHSK